MAKNRRTIQPDQRPLRFTEIHHRLSEGVQYLIQLYYVFKENKETFIPVIEDFLKRVTGQDFEYKVAVIRKPKKWFYPPKGDYFIGGHYLINFDDIQKVWFVKIMDSLQESIKKRIVYHFYPVRWIYKTETSIEDPELKIHPMDTPNEIIEEPFEVNRSIPERWIYKQAIVALRKQERRGQEYPISGRSRKRVGGSKKKVKILSVPDRVYEVRPTTFFGEDLIGLKSIIDSLRRPKPPLEGYPVLSQKEESLIDTLGDGRGDFSIVPSITFDRWHNFFEIPRSLLVNYHIVFGNFERIKVCEYNPCSKLFVEKRAGKKRFCSDACRSKFSTEPIGKLRCRKNQNGWLSYRIKLIKKDHLLAPYLLEKDECKKCDLWHPQGGRLKGGKCEILRGWNQEAFEMIDKKMKKKKIEKS